MENSKEQNNTERIQKMITIARFLIIHYVKQNYSDKDNIEQEIERINNIFDEIDISFDNKVPGAPTEGTNHGNGKITLRFRDKDNVSEDEIADKIEGIIHEIYHSISKKEKRKRNYIFRRRLCNIYYC